MNFFHVHTHWISDYRASKVLLSTDKNFCHFYNSIIIIYGGPLSVIKASIFCSLWLAPVGHKRNYARTHICIHAECTSLFSLRLCLCPRTCVVVQWVMDAQLCLSFGFSLSASSHLRSAGLLLCVRHNLWHAAKWILLQKPCFVFMAQTVSGQYSFHLCTLITTPVSLCTTQSVIFTLTALNADIYDRFYGLTTYTQKVCECFIPIIRSLQFNERKLINLKNLQCSVLSGVL